MSDRRAAVWGASGGIGRALVNALASSCDYRLVHAGCRNPVAPVSTVVKPFTFDLLDESSIAAAATALAAVGPVDLTIVATGMLHDAAGNWPEKSFAALTADAMVASFCINSVGPALIAKHMIQAISMHRRSVFVALSARAGSISDNQLGGWHNYRASKAGLNMIIVNLAIELNARGCLRSPSASILARSTPAFPCRSKKGWQTASCFSQQIARSTCFRSWML